MSQEKPPAPFWQRFDINRIEDLRNAVLGAELEAVQMAGARVRGSLAFAARDGVIFSTGCIRGRVSISGPLSRETITVGVGLTFGPGSRFWLNPVTDGDVAVFLPGEACDVLFAEGSLYLAANLAEERLEEEAARHDLVLDRRTILRTGLHSRPIAPPTLARLQGEVARLHDRCRIVGDEKIGGAVLQAVIEHYARLPAGGAGRSDPTGRGKIVHRAREFIRANLDRPISLDVLAVAAGTSQRTLARAFLEVLGDTPANYVRRLRLHRVRHELVRDAASGRTIREIAAAWGVREPGRMADWYRDLFGEYPRDTLRMNLMRRRQAAAV